MWSIYKTVDEEEIEEVASLTFSEEISGSESGPQGHNEEDSSTVSTDNGNGTHLYGDGGGEEEEEELWRQMAFAQESFKFTLENSQANDLEQTQDCEHSFICKDDTGEVCCVCGLIKTPIENMIEFVYNKPKRSRRSDMREQEKQGILRKQPVFSDKHTGRQDDASDTMLTWWLCAE